MRTAAELAALDAAARSWAGTPFCENSAVKGAGVCCHAAVLEVYFEAEWLPRFHYPFAPIRSVTLATITTQLAISACFATAPEGIAPGDMLILNLGRTCHFMLALPDDRFFHAMEGVGAGIAPNLPPRWQRRLAGVWRPL